MISARDVDKFVDDIQAEAYRKARLDLQAEAEQAARAQAPAEPEPIVGADGYAKAAAAAITPPAFTVDAVEFLR